MDYCSSKLQLLLHSVCGTWLANLADEQWRIQRISWWRRMAYINFLLSVHFAGPAALVEASACSLIVWLMTMWRNVVDSAYEIIKLKGYTSWAIGIMVSTLCNAILKNQRLIYALSTLAKVSPAVLNSCQSFVLYASTQERTGKPSGLWNLLGIPSRQPA